MSMMFLRRAPEGMSALEHCTSLWRRSGIALTLAIALSAASLPALGEETALEPGVIALTSSPT